MNTEVDKQYYVTDLIKRRLYVFEYDKPEAVPDIPVFIYPELSDPLDNDDHPR